MNWQKFSLKPHPGAQLKKRCFLVPRLSTSGVLYVALSIADPATVPVADPATVPVADPTTGPGADLATARLPVVHSYAVLVPP